MYQSKDRLNVKTANSKESSLKEFKITENHWKLYIYFLCKIIENIAGWFKE